MKKKLIASLLYSIATGSDLPLAGAGGPTGGSPQCIEGCPVESWAEANAGIAATGAAYSVAHAWSINPEDPLTEEATPIGRITLKNQVGRTMDSMVWEAMLDDGREVIAKYTNDCRSRLSRLTTDPRDEYFHLLVTNGSGITPNVYGLSHPAMVTIADTPKTHSIFMEENSDACIAAESDVRLLLQDKAGMDIEIYIQLLRRSSMGGDPLFLRGVLALGWKSVEVLQKLHKKGIIHGDIHAGNIMFKTPKDSIEDYDLLADDEEVVLVDFGYARYFVDELKSDPTCPIIPGLNPILLSVWNLYHERTGRRDDIYRVFDMLSMILSDWSREAALESVVAAYIHANPAEAKDLPRRVIRQCKKDFPFFQPSPLLVTGCCHKMGLGERMRAWVQTHLETVFMNVKRIPHPDASPDYDWIIANLKRIESGVREYCEED